MCPVWHLLFMVRIVARQASGSANLRELRVKVRSNLPPNALHEMPKANNKGKHHRKPMPAMLKTLKFARERENLPYSIRETQQ